MIQKDFENYELRLKRLSEESREFFEQSQKIFEEQYSEKLNYIFPEDILGTKKNLKNIFCVLSTEELQNSLWSQSDDVLLKSIALLSKTLPLSQQMQQVFSQSMRSILYTTKLDVSQFIQNWDISRDPLFPLLEDIFADGHISPEEFLLIQQHYAKEQSFHNSLEHISKKWKQSITQELWSLSHSTLWERKELFEQEYASSLEALKNKWFQITPIIAYVSKSYYKTTKRYESPEKRLKRTWKMALLRMLQIRFGSFNIEDMLRQFDSCESFEDFFLLLYKLFEIIGEDEEAQKLFQVAEEKNVIQSLCEDAKTRKEKILKWERVTAKISNIISEIEDQWELWLLDEMLKNSTHFIGEEIHFAHGEQENMAWIYADSDDEEENNEEDDIIDSWDTLQWNYERLKEYFFELDDKKRKAFAVWNYDEIDRINDVLFRVESKIEKLSKLLGE